MFGKTQKLGSKMTWIQLKDGWTDESSEGPYTETLQTKGPWKIVRLYPHHRENDSYKLYHSDFTLDYKFRTIEAAKAYVTSFKELHGSDYPPDIEWDLK